MTDRRDRHQLAPDEARFLERLRAHYAPPPLSDARRAAFDARLRGRLEAGRPRRWVPALGVTVTCAVVLFAWVATDLDRSSPARERVVAGTPAASAWAEQLFRADPSAPSEAADEDAELPPDYEAIEVVLLQG